MDVWGFRRVDYVVKMGNIRSGALSRSAKPMIFPHTRILADLGPSPPLAKGGQGGWSWGYQLRRRSGAAPWGYRAPRLAPCTVYAPRRGGQPPTLILPHKGGGKETGIGDRASRVAMSLLLLLVVTGANGLAADSPDAVLKARGLKKTGLIYVLDGETEFLDKVAKVQPLYDQMTKSYSRLDGILRAQSEYDAMDLQYKLLTERLRNVQAEIDAHPPLSNNMLRQNWNDLLESEKQLRFERNALDRELDLRWKSLLSESKREGLLSEFQKLRQDFLKESRDLRTLIDQVNDSYNQLARDEEVTKAITALRASMKTRISLGPSPEFKRRSTLLKNAEKAFSPASLTAKQKPRNTKGTKPQFAGRFHEVFVDEAGFGNTTTVNGAVFRPVWPMEQRISIVTLGVRDLNQSREFYERLRWRRSMPDVEGIVFFQAGGMVLALFPRHELAKDANVADDGSGFGRFTLAYNVRSRDEVDTMIAEAVAAGAKLVKPAIDAFWGGYSGYFADPDGFLWEVAWNPSFPIGEDGSVRLPG